MIVRLSVRRLLLNGYLLWQAVLAFTCWLSVVPLWAVYLIVTSGGEPQRLRVLTR